MKENNIFIHPKSFFSSKIIEVQTGLQSVLTKDGKIVLMKKPVFKRRSRIKYEKHAR